MLPFGASEENDLHKTGDGRGGSARRQVDGATIKIKSKQVAWPLSC